MNLLSMLDERADQAKPALIHRDRVITFEELATTVSAVHRGLARLGVEPGDRVVLLAGTTPNFVAALFGVIHAGAVAVPANPLSPSPEMAAEIATVRPALVMVGPAGASALAGCDIDVPVVALPGADVDGAISFDDLIGAETGAGPLPAVAREPDDLALLLFTSGTAGTPKAAMLSHDNLVANVEQVERHRPGMVGPDDVALGVLPLFHVLGLSSLFGTVLRAGASMVLVERFDPIGAAALVRDHGVTLVSGPPTMWKGWADHPEVAADDFATLRIAVSGAAGLSREVAAHVLERLGIRLSQGYGLTETSPVLTLGTGLGAPSTSVGRPVPGVELRLVDAAGDDVPAGDEGEVLARGRNVFHGYWDDERATADVLSSDGWLRTGDIGVVDDDGYLYIVDRSKDVVLVSGFNVFPGEVEAVLLEHPGIEEAAVIGVPDPSTGESVKAFVVPVADAGDIDENEIVAWCAARMARYKCPQAVEVVASLPRGGAIGKMRRRELRSVPDAP